MPNIGQNSEHEDKKSISFRILFCLCLIFTAPLLTHANEKINTENCLNHMGGGGLGDERCYAENAKALHNESQFIYRKIRRKIPSRNPKLKLLDEYMLSQDDALRFCELPRDAGTEWIKSNNGSMYPMLYQKCIYKLRKSQNLFLKDLFIMSNW